VTGGDEERPRTNAAGDPAESAPDTTGRGADAEAGTGTGTAGERETDADPNADTRSTERAAATDSTERPEATRTATTAASPTGTAPGGPDPTADEGRSGEGLRGVPVLGGLLATGDDYPVAWSLVVAVGLALVALVVGFTLVLGSLLGLGAAGIAASPTVQIVASLLLFQGVTMGGVAAVYLSVRGLDADYVGLSLEKVFGDPVRDVLAAVVGFVVALGVAFGGAAIVSTFGVQAGTNQAADLAFEDPEVLLFLIPGAFLLIGPGEELLFRGVIQSRLRETIGRWPAVVVGAALFAAVHVTALSGGASARLVSITILFFPSLVFGAVYEFTDNLAVPALVHGAYNALIFTVLYLAIRFADLSADAVQSGLVRPP
jgi:membrane protease YdiL (CAAX protease family)